jgi:hypothetical protein
MSSLGVRIPEINSIEGISSGSNSILFRKKPKENYQGSQKCQADAKKTKKTAFNGTEGHKHQIFTRFISHVKGSTPFFFKKSDDKPKPPYLYKKFKNSTLIYNMILEVLFTPTIPALHGNLKSKTKVRLTTNKQILRIFKKIEI